MNLEGRSANARRKVYEPNAPQEQFIVPLIKRYVDDFCDNHIADHCEGKSLLDVGCGSQPFRELFEAKGLTYYGLDVASTNGRELDFLCPIDAPLIDSLRNQAFDYIFCTEVLEHVANWPAAFENLASVLKPGGKLFITCPHVYQLHEEPFDYFRPTVHAIEHFGQQNHLKTIHLERAGCDWKVLGTMIANTRFSPAIGRFYDRQLARIAEFCRRWILKSLIANKLQQSVQASCSIYLSNIAILQKEAAGE